MGNDYLMTAAGKRGLEQELKDLKGKKRQALSEQIRQARMFCDFSEDVSFKEMINEQARLEERIKSMETILDNAKIIQSNQQAASVIDIGSIVTFIEQPNGEEETYMIVSTAEANPSEHKISSESPIAKSLLGHQVGDEVFIQTPSGKMKVRISNVK